MQLSKKIIVLDNVLSDAECLDAIKAFNFARVRRSPDIETYRDTLLLQVNQNSDILVSLSHKIRNAIAFMTNDIDIDWCQIVEWKLGSKQAYHRDTASDNTVFTSITYLNDDYAGGETSFFNDMNIVPKTGRTVYFDGNHYVHGVNEIKNGVRYSFPIWYKQISVV
jgi:hypothetical protein